MSETRADELERIWVSMDYIRAGQVAGFRGRMASIDFEAIVQGGFLPPFVLLEDVHWVESVWDEEKECNLIKVSAYGRDGTSRLHNGEIYLRPENIASISTLKDCQDVLLEENRSQPEDRFAVAKPVMPDHVHTEETTDIDHQP